MKNFCKYIFLTVALVLVSCGKQDKGTVLDNLPPEIAHYIDSIQVAPMGPYKPTISVEKRDDNTVTVHLEYSILDTLRLDDWRLDITPSFASNFHWAPHLSPTDEHIIAQHVFRAPALVVTGEGKELVVMPDLNVLQKGSPVQWYMDMDAPKNKLTLGLSNTQVAEHVLYKRKPGAVYAPQKLEFGFTLMVSDKAEDLQDPWRKPLAFLWKNWGEPLYKAGQPLNTDLEKYVQHTYYWAFDSWKDAVWQEFELNGKKVGAPVFIVNVTQSPNYPGQVDQREFVSIWNQAWFSSLRSASGLYRYARRTQNQDLMQKAEMGKELALAFPQTKGFFKGLIATEMEEVTVDGKTYNRSKGWNTHYFGNSNRNPYTWDPKESPYHILDMSWTAYLMLNWYDELEKDSRLLDYATRYADTLLGIQEPNGFFPGWLSLDNFQPMEYLNDSPETSMSVTFLLKLYQITQEPKYRDAALKAMQAVMDQVVPTGRWEDFETYWSCSRYGSKDLVNKKVERNDMYKQNNLSMYWTAQALYNSYKSTGDKKYLELGQRTLDEMLMTQATWQPPYMFVSTLGGFGVMNGDGEWNDSRQSLFAELILKYGQELHNEEYMQRGMAALKASFTMMYCPENPKTKTQWEERWDFFGPEDYGFMMENYGHAGTTDSKGLGIGEFTIYDWGNGAASEAYNRILDHMGKDIFQQQ